MVVLLLMTQSQWSDMTSAALTQFCQNSQGKQLEIVEIILCLDFVCFKTIRPQLNKNDSCVWCHIIKLMVGGMKNIHNMLT